MARSASAYERRTSKMRVIFGMVLEISATEGRNAGDESPI